VRLRSSCVSTVILMTTLWKGCGFQGSV